MREVDFLAPEGRFTKEEFERREHWKPVDEKSDIWKIPFLTKMLLTTDRRENTQEEADIMSQLEYIHSQCNKNDPRKRPTSKEVLMEYLLTYERLYT